MINTDKDPWWEDECTDCDCASKAREDECLCQCHGWERNDIEESWSDVLEDES